MGMTESNVAEDLRMPFRGTNPCLGTIDHLSPVIYADVLGRLHLDNVHIETDDFSWRVAHDEL